MSTRPSPVTLRALLLCAWLLIPCVAAPLPGAESYALVISGDPGRPLAGPGSSLGDWSANFDRWRLAWQGLLVDTYHLPAAQVRVMPETGVGAPGAADRPVTHAQVLAALAELVARCGADDQAVVVLIGHGYHSGPSAQFCLADRDLTDTDLAQALAPLRCRELVLLVLAPDCRAMARSLAGPGRIIILANVKASAPYFSEFLLRALAPGAVPLLGAFNQAALDTIHWYQNQAWLRDRKVWLVHGTVNQAVWRLVYPRGTMLAGDDQAHVIVDTPGPDEAAAITGRRLPSESAGLEDNGDGEVSTVYDGGPVANALPGLPGADGALSATLTLGKP